MKNNNFCGHILLKKANETKDKIHEARKRTASNNKYRMIMTMTGAQLARSLGLKYES